MLIICLKKLPCGNQLLDQLLVNSIKQTSTWHSIIGSTISQISQNKHPHGNQLLDHKCKANQLEQTSIW